MTKSNCNIKYAFLIMIISFMSCEGGTTFTKTIYNNSDESMDITVFTNLNDSRTHTIPAQSETQIYFSDRIGFFVDETYTCLDEIDSIQVIMTNGKTLDLDIMDDSNWINSSKDGRNSREDCEFSFDNDDLN